MERQKRRKKSKAKIVGVKSTFVLDTNKLLMTSFGENNVAIAEKDVRNDSRTVKNLREHGDFNANHGDVNLSVKSTDNHMTAKVANPLYAGKEKNQATKDYRERVAAFKSKCDTTYSTIVFEKPYSDNIHPQIVSKILDIEKAFSITVGNLVYAVNNMMHEDLSEISNDYLFDKNEFEDEEKETILQNSLYLFGDMIPEPVSEEEVKKKVPRGLDEKEKKEKIQEIKKSLNEERNKESVKKIQAIIGILKFVRNDSFHGFNYNDKSAVKIPKKKYNIARQNDERRIEISAPLTWKLENLKKDFLKTAKVDMKMLNEILYGGNASKSELEGLAEQYFAFVVLKKDKNLGFSITSLREQLFEKFGINLEDAGNLRPRMNRFCDFLLYHYYQDDANDAAVSLVKKLRQTESDEDKARVYQKEAESIQDKFKAGFIKISNFDVAYIEAAKKTDNQSYENVAVRYDFENTNMFEPTDTKARQNADLFCNLVFYLTRFLDGKEINIFVTDLIHIFENIASFTEVLKDQKIEAEFTKDFKMFDESAYIAAKLYTVRSIARMKKTLDRYNGQCLKDAISLLGTSEQHKELEIDDYLTQYLFDNGNKNEGADHNLRNFLVSNVIRSKKFNYIMRYANPNTVGEFAKNENLVRFVLQSRIESSMIERYYRSVYGERKAAAASFEKKITDLTQSVVNMNVDVFEHVVNKNGENELDRDQKRALVGFYLNVLYQIVKNLMYVNSRYVLAFAFTERDLIVSKLQEVKGKRIENLCALTEYYLDNNLFKTATPAIRESIKLKKENGLTEYEKNMADPDKTATPEGREEIESAKEKCLEEYEKNIEALNHIPGEYISKRMEGYDEGATGCFRNSVAHLNMMMKAPEYIQDIKEITSYYQVYHYCMQKHILWVAEKEAEKREVEQNAILKQALETTKTYHTYSKDAVKYLCLPFAYNVARYKSLSTEGLFDWTEYGKDDE